MRDHRRMDVFRISDELTLRIYQATRDFPDGEQYGLASQLRRAAVSVGANIVEGAARSSQTEFARYLSIAYGSAREVEYELSIAMRLEYLDKRTAKVLLGDSSRLRRALRAFILALRKPEKAKGSHSGPSPAGRIAQLASWPVGQLAS